MGVPLCEPLNRESECKAGAVPAAVSFRVSPLTYQTTTVTVFNYCGWEDRKDRNKARRPAYCNL